MNKNITLFKTAVVAATFIALLVAVPATEAWAIYRLPPVNSIDTMNTNTTLNWEAPSYAPPELVREANMTSNLTQVLNQTPNWEAPTTEDDGYVYRDNATVEEKAKIDSQQRFLWEQAGRPGEPEPEPEPNPYCDLVSDEYMESGGVCHDRKDASDITGLFTCNDGTHKTDWRYCPDATMTTIP